MEDKAKITVGVVKVDRDLVHTCNKKRESALKMIDFENIHTHTHLLRVRASACLEQDPGLSSYAGFNCQDNNYDSDVHNTVDDEELPEKSQSGKMFGLCHRGRALGCEGTRVDLRKKKPALYGRQAPPTSCSSPRLAEMNALLWARY